MDFSEDAVNCDGTDPLIVLSRSCQIPMNSLRLAPYNLDYPDIVIAKVRSRNLIGWSELSDANVIGGKVLTEPVAEG